MPGGFLQAARNWKELQSADVNRNFKVCWALWIDFLHSHIIVFEEKKKVSAGGKERKKWS